MFESFLQRLASRLTACEAALACPRAARRRTRLALTSCAKVGEPATSGFACFLEAANPDKGVGQLGKAAADHLPVAEIGINLEHLAKIGECRIPLLKTQLGHREARQQLGFFSRVKSALIRQGGSKTAPRFFECRSLKGVLRPQASGSGPVSGRPRTIRP